MSDKPIYVIVISQGWYSNRETAPYMYCTSERAAQAACKRVKDILTKVYSRIGDGESSLNLGSWLFNKRSKAPWPFEYFADEHTIEVTYVLLERWRAGQGEVD